MGTTAHSTGRVLHNMVTTAFEIDGYRIVRNLGVVRGIVVRSRSIFGTLGASLQTLEATSPCSANCASRPAAMLSTSCSSTPPRSGPMP